MKTKRTFFWISGMILGFFMLALFLPLAARPSPLRGILECVPFGWWQFLKRNVPQLTLNWGLIATGLICSVVVIVVGNWFLRAILLHSQRVLDSRQAVQRWRWRWTFCIYCGIWLLFLVAFGSAGVLRHSTWLMGYRGPWYQERASSYAEIKMVNLVLQEVLLDNNEALEPTRKDLATRRSHRRRQLALSEEFNVILYGDESNHVAAYLIIPRNPALLAKGRFGACIGGTNGLVLPISELQQTIHKLNALYLSGDL